ncbi:MAG: hypothetical protein AAFX04_13575 [Pseudomonadota bacterium]
MHWFRSHVLAIAPALSSLSAMALSPILVQLLSPEDGVMLISLCSSDGVEQTIAVPLGDGADGDGDAPMDHCKMACHAACSRKDQGKPAQKPKL